jgi:hypothetical protein
LTIKTFIQRFEKYPELKTRAKLFALSDKWESDGIFFMTVSLLCASQQTIKLSQSQSERVRERRKLIKRVFVKQQM